MNEDKHVPGPWKVEVASDEDSDNYVYTVKEARDGDILGICDLNRYNKSHETLVATAELIASAPQLREQNRVLRGLVVHVEQIEADLHAALNGTRHDPSWIRPIQLSRNERQELYLGCIKDLQALKAALTATSQPGGTHEL